MIKIKPFVITALLLAGLSLPAAAQIGEPRNNLSVGFNGGVNLNSVSFTPTIKQNSLMGISLNEDGTSYLRLFRQMPTDMK